MIYISYHLASHNMLNQNHAHFLAAHIQNMLLLNKIIVYNYRLWLNNVTKVNLKPMYNLFYQSNILHHTSLNHCLIVWFHYLHLLHATIILPNNIFSNQLTMGSRKWKLVFLIRFAFGVLFLHYHVISSHAW